MKIPRLFISSLILALTLLGSGTVLAQEKTGLKETEAIALYEKAIKGDAKALAELRGRAEKGEASAQRFLGMMYEYGKGVAKDEVEAVKWFRKAAEWFRKAADQGDADAQRVLGMMYEYGKGVAKDEVEAVKWFRKAAEWYRKAADQGDAAGQFNLGGMYAYGQGVAKDVVEAYKWWLLAGAQGFGLAKRGIPVIEGALTAAERAEGQKLAREWKPGK